MPKPSKEDEVLKRMLKTPPKPFTPKAKKKAPARKDKPSQKAAPDFNPYAIYRDRPLRSISAG